MIESEKIRRFTTEDHYIGSNASFYISIETETGEKFYLKEFRDQEKRDQVFSRLQAALDPELEYKFAGLGDL